ncbi:MAG: ArsR family transcriptional regulator [Candidatus Thorarchaeota archaeon]|nr:ArsR family transcriptional regulator [Candidatus Thorarchaeota archaeon]
MVNPERVSELFSELSDSNRLKILLAVDQKSLKQSEIVKKAGLSSQNTTGHLSRLTNANLVIKDAKGYYSTTPLGRQVAALFPTVNFLSSNAGYFADHDPSCIPSHFQYGLGLIEDYRTTGDAAQSVKEIENLIKKAQDFVWIHSDQVLSSSLPLIDDALERGLEFRVILPRELSEQGDHLMSYPQVLEHQHTLAHDRFIESVRLVIVLSEKQALLGFPTTDGHPDYTGFSIRNRSALAWCKDLFLHFWALAKQL